MSIRQPLAVIILMVMAMSLVWSRALLSILPPILLLIAFTDIQVNPFKIRWTLSWEKIKTSVRDRPYLWVLTLFFFLYFFSVVYAGNVSEWWKLTHVKLHFLLIPMAFALLPSFSRKEYMLVVLCMVITALWSTIWVQVAYYSNHYVFSKSLGFGGSLPTPINHIRYSVVIAAGLIICTAFAIENWKMKFKWERWAYGIAAIYLFYFLHVLSVRSGLALGYAGIFILVICYVQKLSRLKQYAIILALLIAPVIAYKTMPGFKLKVDYTNFDLEKFIAGEGEDYSDAERWQSWRAGLVVGNRHAFFGTGTGHFRDTMETYYKTELKKDSWTRPHNQWINVFTIFGLTGLILFTLVIFFPMTFPFFWKLALIPTLYMVQLLSMIVEHPLDTTFGTSLFLVLSCLGLSVAEKTLKEPGNI